MKLSDLSLAQLRTKIKEEYPDTDLYLYFGPILSPYDVRVTDLIRAHKKQKHVILFMTTPGGSPDAAYRIARTIQHQYNIR